MLPIPQILTIVSRQAGIKLPANRRRRAGTNMATIRARYVAMAIMFEEGYHLTRVAATFGLHRTSIYNAIRAIDAGLQTDKLFKQLYLGSIASIAQLEEKEEQTCN